MKITSLFRQGLLAVALTVSMSTIATAGEITGAGSTFVYPILAKWSNDYNKMTGDRINYQSIGSGGGIAQIKASTVTFGASDKPMSPKELSEVGLGQFPLVIGGVVPVVNLDGVVPGTLKFTGAILADIYLGKITKWNDPALVKINANIKLPDAKITVVHRSDGSGTTFNWVNYLSKVSNEWKDKVGEGTSVSWPLGVGGKGNEGVAAYVKQLKNSIGYVEYAYVKQNKMNFAQVQNKAGKFVSPDADSFQSAAAYADWSKVQDFDFVITDAPGDRSFPISATTFVLLYKQAKNPEQQKAAFTFFKWALERGGPQADELDYVPLPPALVKQIEAYWAKNFNFGS